MIARKGLALDNLIGDGDRFVGLLGAMSSVCPFSKDASHGDQRYWQFRMQA